MFPLLIGLMACANEFVSAVLTDKWQPAVPFLRILSVYYLLEPLMALNKQIVIACGQAKKYLEMEVQKKAIGIVILIIAIFWFDSVSAIAIAAVLTQLIGLSIQSLPLRDLIQYPIEEQLSDIKTPLLLSFVMVIPVVLLKGFPMNAWIKLGLQVLSGVGVYVGLSVLFKNEIFYSLLQIGKKMIRKK